MSAAWSRFAGGLRALLRRRQVERELDEELQAYLEASVDGKIARGVPPGQALRLARAEMGSAEAVKDDVRDAGWETLVESVWQDVRYAWRMLMKAPAFAAVAVIVLGLGIGASASIFSALDAVLLRPLPYPDAGRLVQVFEVNDTGGLNNVSGGAFRDWVEHGDAFDALVLYGDVTANLRGPGATERVTGLEVTTSFLRVFGLQPLLGRGFVAGEDAYGGPTSVVMITEELWRSRLGGDPGIVGATIVLDETPRTVIGVLPRGALPFRGFDFLVPAVLQPETPRASRSSHWAEVTGRLKRGVTADQADAELKALKRRLAGEYPQYKQRWDVAVRPLRDILAGDPRPTAGTPRQLVLVLVSFVLVVLLIACANIAGLLLARAQNRQTEIALRAALGAGGGRLVRQVLTESLLLAAMGGALGVALAYWGVDLVRRVTIDILPQVMAPRLDGRVLAFSVIVSLGTGVLFGLLPALRARRPDVNEALKHGGKNTTGARHRTQSLLVAGEIALTVVLLVSAGLLLRSLAKVGGVDPGFDPERVLAFEFSLPDARYGSPAARLAFSRELLGRIRELPGVDAAGAGQAVPFSGGGSGEYLRRPDQPADRDIVTGRVDLVSEGYLEALGARLLAGRFLRASDNTPDAAPVAVISETTVARFFGDRDPIGQSIVVAGQPFEIVGVIADMVDRTLDASARPFVYLPQALEPSSFSIVVRSPGEPLRLAGAVRRELQRLDPGLPIANVRSLEQSMSRSMADRRTVLGLLGGFAAAALALACIGIYGRMAYSVATRRRELCIRMALGAARGDVVRLVLREGLRLTAIGVGAGLVVSLAAARLLESQLFQVRSYDPAAIAGTVSVVAIVTLLACWLPARRGSLASPMSVLRAE